MTGKKQTLIVIGIALVLIGFILAYFSLSQPKVYIDADSPLPDSSLNSTAVSEKVTDYDDSNEPIMKYPLNLNTCTIDELMTIDGIGEAKASAIIEYREYIGGYSSVDEIKNIKGIGEALYEKLSPYLCV